MSFVDFIYGRARKNRSVLLWQSAKKSQRSAIWCGFCFEVWLMWPFVLQFSSSPFDLIFFLCPLWWVPSLMKSLMVTSRHIYFLQCSSFGEVDFVDLEIRFCFPFWVSPC